MHLKVRIVYWKNFFPYLENKQKNPQNHSKNHQQAQ